MTRYTTRPMEIDAIQFTGRNTPEVKAFVSEMLVKHEDQLAEFLESLTNAPFSLFVPKSSKTQSTQAWNYIKGEDWSGKITAAVYDYLHETWVGVESGNYIICGMKGEFYPCASDVFETKYEPVSTG